MTSHSRSLLSCYLRHEHTTRWTVSVVIMEKTQATAFHLRNKEAKRSLKVVWNKTELENTTHPKHIGVTLDRSLSYKQHIRNTKMKVATRNNLLTKLATSKWGANPSTIRTTALALTYSTPCQEPGPRTKSGMPVRHRMPKAYQRWRLVFVIGNSPSCYQKRYMC